MNGKQSYITFIILCISIITIIIFAISVLFTSKDPTYHNNLGLIYLKKSEFDNAMYEFRQALQLREAYEEVVERTDPIYVEIHVNLGTTYFMKGMYDKALREYKKALDISQWYGTGQKLNIYNSVGVIYFKEGHYGKARKVWEKALEIDPNYSPALENLEFLKKRY